MIEKVIILCSETPFRSHKNIYEDVRFYVCPLCKNDNVRGDYRFCPDCGVEVEWR